MSKIYKNIIAIVSTIFIPLNSYAHHEAIFGPQSASMLSNDKYFGIQLFTRQNGLKNKSRETTSLVTMGVTPFKNNPLSFNVIAPYSFVNSIDNSKSGIEDIILGARYKYDLDSLNKMWDREGNYLMMMTSVELNNGVIDYDPFKGPIDYMGALTASFEYGNFSAIGYSFYRLNGIESNKNKSGDKMFLGGGLAYTPNENFETGSLISYQLGFTFENYFSDFSNGSFDKNTGGQTFLIHPTISYSPGYNFLFFGVFSIPIYQSFANKEDNEDFRIGTGITYSF